MIQKSFLCKSKDHIAVVLLPNFYLLLGHLLFFLHFFLTFMMNLFKNHPIFVNMAFSRYFKASLIILVEAEFCFQWVRYGGVHLYYIYARNFAFKTCFSFFLSMIKDLIVWEWSASANTTDIKYKRYEKLLQCFSQVR